MEILKNVFSLLFPLFFLPVFVGLIKPGLGKQSSYMKMFYVSLGVLFVIFVLGTIRPYDENQNVSEEIYVYVPERKWGTYHAFPIYMHNTSEDGFPISINIKKASLFSEKKAYETWLWQYERIAGESKWLENSAIATGSGFVTAYTGIKAEDEGLYLNPNKMKGRPAKLKWPKLLSKAIQRGDIGCIHVTDIQTKWVEYDKESKLKWVDNYSKERIKLPSGLVALEIEFTVQNSSKKEKIYISNQFYVVDKYDSLIYRFVKPGDSKNSGSFSINPGSTNTFKLITGMKPYSEVVNTNPVAIVNLFLGFRWDVPPIPMQLALSGGKEELPDSAVETKPMVLSESIEFSNITEIRKLIKARADINIINKNGYSPLLMASDKGYTEVVKLLLDAKADVNKAMENGVTPLWQASWQGHTEVVKLLLGARADVNKAKENGNTPLLMASDNGHTDITKLLLDANANVNRDNTYGVTPLFMASQNGHTEVVKLLLVANADVDKAMTRDGATPLLIAIQNGHAEIIKLLLDAGADVNQTNTDGVTPLLEASYNGNTKVVKILLDAMADVNKTSIDCETPLLLASYKGNSKVAKLLLDARADVNKANIYGVTPLLIASRGGHIEVVKLLLDAKANVNKAKKNGVTPLLIASQEGHTEIVKLLKENGAKE